MKRTHREAVRLLIASLIIAGACAIAPSGCKGPSGFQISDSQITLAVSTGTALTFRFALKDDAKRTMIANYVSAIAGAARSLTGNETPDQVAKVLTSRIPANVLADCPEIGSIVVPQVVSYYQTAKEKFGSGTKEFLSRMNAVAAGLEQGVASYISH